MELNKKPYRSQTKRLMLLGYQIRVQKNPEGSTKKYTRYWVDAQGWPCGEVGNEESEKRMIEASTKTSTE